MKTQNKQVPFSRLNKAAQRVAIARDIIAQLKAKKAIAESQTFLRFNGADYDMLKGKTTLREVQSVSRSCSVCAIGSIILAQLNVNGDVKTDEVCTYKDYTSGDFTVDARTSRFSNNLSPYVTKYFDEKQLQMIEIAFEVGDGAYLITNFTQNRYLWQECVEGNKLIVSQLEALQAMKFGKRYKNITNRMIAIMNNIIDNDGEFVP